VLVAAELKADRIAIPSAVGLWRSWERFHDMEKAVGSNPTRSTKALHGRNFRRQ
jgi:hypothetical protein